MNEGITLQQTNPTQIQIDKSYISIYTGSEIDQGVTRANTLWFNSIEAEEVQNPINAITDDED